MATLSLAALLLALPAANGVAQDPTSTEPTEGLRRNPPNVYALRGARVVTEPGQAIEGATVLIDGRSITAVGTDVEIPTGTEVIDCSGKTIFAGLIDAWSEVDVPRPDADAGYWNAHITPERSTRSKAATLPSNAKKLRSQGITARLIAPGGGIVKGTSCVALLGGIDPGIRLLRDDVFTHLQLTVPRRNRGSSPRYPNSPMGAVALLRQTLLDANWYRDAWQAYRSQSGVPRPEANLALQTLSEATLKGSFVADAPNERMAIRADGIAKEFSLKLLLRGSGREYQRLEEIHRAGRPILLPVDFPEPPNVATRQRAMEVSLRDLMHWHLAPENPGRLAKAGVKFCLTSDGLDDAGKFLKQVRQAVQRGLPADDALAAVTTHPAELLGIDEVAGRVRPGMLANLVVADGDLFASKSKVIETWIAGQRFEVEPVADVGVEEIVGRWDVSFQHNGTSHRWLLDLQRKNNGLTGKVSLPESDDAQPSDTDAEKTSESVPLKDLIRHRDRLTASVDAKSLSDEFAPGVYRMAWVTVTDDADALTVFATLVDPAGNVIPLQTHRVGPLPEEAGSKDDTPDDAPSENPETEDSVVEEDHEETEQEDTEQDAPEEREAGREELAIDLHYPLGAYGRTERPEQAQAVLFRTATIWTCAERGVLERSDLLVVDGKIEQVGENVSVPENAIVVDASGKHLTPGLIDCHSHMATDGGINESGQAVTAEVRIGDFIDNTDIHIYRQLAGGLTIANILHGSANPIGGQNQVIKLRWGGSMEQLRMREAPPGIKFALGENVKRRSSRYPNTRMGVEQIIRDQLLAAREYASKWRRWNEGERNGLPPRRDLQLEALAEIQRGQRWIHCHSYRQDEIVATLDVLEEFGIQIGTLQHILEGYKVADRMVRHGAMASAFSDWWAYKFEVYDAIPYNGVLMHDAGLVVSYNSDDRELARRMNTEAAKAVKYGGVAPEEALKFVTTNPAKQLRIDDRVGTLEPGKDADLVLWSGPPLSTTTRCEQTWIDGRRYFDTQADQELRRRDANLHAKLTQRVLNKGDQNEEADKNNSSSDASRGNDESQLAEEDRWVRYDVFCNALGSQVSDREDR